MSIFRDTFTPEISASLAVRQNAMVNRTPQNIQYLNARNSWIRMTSAVNIYNGPTPASQDDIDNPGNYTNSLAKQYVLLGGTLNQNQVTTPGGAKVDVFTPKAGVGDASKAYSRTTPSGKNHRLGIRPMPGIVSMDIKSLTAYGSLRQATVNFTCWDIRQLEELELLYMRPGYTVLIEWGWLPYLDTKGNLVTNLPQFYDILNKPETNRTVIFKEIYEKSKKSGGNYEAMYGYIKNYQWSARPDGGYDCQTTIISTGEIIESLKVNYVRPDLNIFNSATAGLLNDEFDNQGSVAASTLVKYYQKNILAGLWAETYIKLLDSNSSVKDTSIFKDNYARFNFQGITQKTSDIEVTAASGSQVYITLEAMFDVINKYVSPKSSGDQEPLISLSLTSSNIVNNGTGSDLYCVAHPTQISINPTICLINSPLWTDSGKIVTALNQSDLSSVSGIADSINNLRGADRKGLLINMTQGQAERNVGLLVEEIKKIKNSKDFALLEQALGTSIQNIINQEIGSKQLVYNVTEFNLSKLIKELRLISGLVVVPTITTTNNSSWLQNISIQNTTPLTADVSSLNLPGDIKQALGTLNLLQVLKPFFYNDPYSEIGIIKNIYVNVEFLYNKALDADGSLESQDTKQKNEINLYNYVKSIISAVQQSIGNINNFEIHVDPVDNNVARVIDINYTQPDKAKRDTLFELQVHNLKSVVRTYSLQSQIFPNQSSIIAIGSQAKGGQLGIQNNTMIDFNRTLRDRIIPEKIFGGNDSLNVTNNTTPIAANLAGIIKLFSALSTPPPTAPSNSQTPSPTSTEGVGFNALYNEAKNNLRDIIVYFQSVTASPGANRNIIPVQFSFEMDGIGGLIIGHLFKINDDILPIGYRGPNLAQTVTRIGHTISNNDWTTKIDALNIVLDDKSGTPFSSLDLTKIINESLEKAFANNLPTNEPIGGGSNICGDQTNRSGKWKNLPYEPYVRTSVSISEVIPYIKTLTSYSQSVRRAVYAIFKIESAAGQKGVNNNYIGLQTDGGGFIATDTDYVKGTTSRVDSGGQCRAFATYASWQKCIDHLAAVLNSRTQSGSSSRKMVPTTPDDAAYFGQGYAKNWVGKTDLIAINISAKTGADLYREAISRGI